MRDTSVFLALALSAGLSLAACDIKTTADGEFSLGVASGRAEDTWSRTYTLAPGATLELININGRIDAQPAAGAAVELIGKRTAKASSDEAAKDLLGQIEMREEVGDQRVRVEVRTPRLRGLSGHEVEWTVRVPAGVHVDFRTVNGGVKMTGLDGAIAAKTTNGGVTGTDLAASVVEASTVNGGVNVGFRADIAPDGRVELESVNGGVEVGLTAATRATISARAVNGGVQVRDLDVERTAQSSDFESKRRLEGTLNGGGARITLNTVNGGVRISRAARPTT